MMLIDLTMDLDERTPIYPGDPKPEIIEAATIDKDGWNEKRLSFNSHFGTHIDAPFHMIEKGKKLTDFGMEKFIGEGIVIDVRGSKEINADLTIVKTDDIVFFFTRHSENAYSDSYVSDWPVISETMAKELVRKGVKIIGTDTPSPDKSPFSVHKLLFKHDILIVENLVNLKQLAGKRFECIILPLKIRDADGAPCRVVARLP